MNKKERTIKAVLKTAEKYENPKGHVFFAPDHCEICKVHKRGEDCKGCPSANIMGNAGCWEFKSLNEAFDSIDNEKYGLEINEPTPEFLKRASVLRGYAKIFESLPPERFTKKGGGYFDMLDRND